MNIRVLLVEDNVDLASTVIQYFELQGIECDYVGNGQSGLNLAVKNIYDVFILDLNLPGMDGLSICENLRAEGIDSPVLMLTARDTLEDKLSGFESGTDDYMVKPFSLQELKARVLALAKRRSGQSRKLQVADIEMDLETKQVSKQGVPLSLSPTCWIILEKLLRKSPNVVSKQDLEHAIWGDEPPESNNLKVHMHNLRKAVNEKGQPALLETVWGHGFVIRAHS